jgi:hypothetical protein
MARTRKTLADTIREQEAKRAGRRAAPATPEDEWPAHLRGDLTDEPESEGVKPEAGANHSWPAPPGEDAFHGLAGEVVGTIAPETEADRVALLVQFLVAFGSAAGRNAYYPVEASCHYGNLFAVLVGRTSKGRKGTALGWVKRLFPDEVAPGWQDRVQMGLSSGEGLIAEVQDKSTRDEPVKAKGRVTGYQEVVVHKGVSDKRLLVVEEEFASVLRVAARDGNTLSAVLRQAWDGGRLRSMTKNNPVKATDAHVSIIGHITKEELAHSLSQTDTANGFANRFLWVCVRRSKLLPDGGRQLDLAALQGRVKAALAHAQQAGPMSRSPEAAALWRERYAGLSAERPGLLGLVINRAEAQVLRLSCLYALLDDAEVVEAEHLRAALALWGYCERSAAYVFGESTGSRDADQLLDALRQAGGEGLNLTQMSAVFNRNRTAGQIDKLLAYLQEFGLAAPCEAVAGSKARKWLAATNLTNLTNPGGA